MGAVTQCHYEAFARLHVSSGSFIFDCIHGAHLIRTNLWLPSLACAASCSRDIDARHRGLLPSALRRCSVLWGCGTACSCRQSRPGPRVPRPGTTPTASHPARLGAAATMRCAMRCAMRSAIDCHMRCETGCDLSVALLLLRLRSRSRSRRCRSPSTGRLVAASVECSRTWEEMGG